MARIIDFFDGAQSETAPTIGNIIASGIITYPDDATYEATEQGAPAAGNIYFNTTTNFLRYYNGTSWIDIVDDESLQVIVNKSIDADNNIITNIANDEIKAAAAIDVTKLHDGSVDNTEFGYLDGVTSGIQAQLDAKQDTSEKDMPNGYPGLDGSGKLDESVLPVTTLLFQGTWDADTNTPTLSDGTGTQSHVYRVSVAGTQDLGSGSIDFEVGDWVTHNGSIWQRSDYVGAGVLNDLADVQSPTPLDNNVLKYNSGSGDWENGDISVSELFDSVISSPTDGQVFTYSTGAGNKWINASPAGGTKSISPQSANYVITGSGDDVVLMTTGAVSKTVTLPDASTVTGRSFTVKKEDAAAGSVVLQTVSSQTIENADIWSGEYYLNQQDSQVTVTSDGGDWVIDSTTVHNEEIQVGAIVNLTQNYTINVWQDITSFTVLPGIWVVDAKILYQRNAVATAGFNINNGISSTAGNSATGLDFTDGSQDVQLVIPTSFFTTKNFLIPRITSLSPTTFYLKQLATITDVISLTLVTYTIKLRRVK